MLRAVNDLSDPTRVARRPDWDRIDTVCLDMDGTVLDQRFDNLFWLEVLPQRWAEARGLSHAEGTAELMRRFEAKRGTLEWYCDDHWSDDLGLDLASLKHDLRHEIRYLDGALTFLGHVRALGKRLVRQRRVRLQQIEQPQVGCIQREIVGRFVHIQPSCAVFHHHLRKATDYSSFRPNMKALHNAC